MSIHKKIQSLYSDMTPKEKEIAKYLLSHSSKVANITIKELAVKTDTSPATITRFSKKMGCENFVELKIKLHTKEEINKDKDMTLAKEIYSFYLEVLQKNEESVEPQKVIEFTESIKSADRIHIYGVGSSGLTAMEFTQRLLRMGLNASSTADTHMMKINSSIMKDNDVVIGISASGETIEVIDAVELAKKEGAKAMSITSMKHSTLYENSDLALVSYSSIFIDQKRFVNSQFSIMHLVDIISMLLLEDEGLKNKMNRTVDVIQTKEE